MTRNRRSYRSSLMLGVALGSMLSASPALAQNFGARRTVDPAAQAAQAAQGAASRNAQAQAAAARTRAAFEQASRVRTQMDAAQAAARAAALAAQSTIRNGLGEGGLNVANGVSLDPSLWVGANGPTQAQGSDGRVTVTVGQTQEKAILTWDSFNVGRETDLVFDHKGNNSWMTLNRVTSAGADPSQILGSIKAAGSVYIINPNGVIFGGASQVNVRSLIASSLEIHGGAVEYTRPTGASDQVWENFKRAARDQRFMDGILAANPSSLEDAPLTFYDGTNLNNDVDRVRKDEVFAAYDGVTVEAGAQIKVGGSQQAVLIGHNVTNKGSIAADDGQVLLAAGRAVLLLDGTKRQRYQGLDGQSVDGEAVRGFLAGVDRGGEAVNSGLIDVGLGNITLTGKNVTQAGVLSALTSGEMPGSILLQARDGMSSQGNQIQHGRVLNGDLNDLLNAGWGPFVRYQWGTVTFADGSYISVLPDADAAPVVGNPYMPSWMQVEGNRIQFLGSASIYMPSGNIELKALYASGSNNTPNDSRIYIDRGATIDLSGLGGIEVDMDQNSVRAELRANELADNPIMRDSELRGETIWFDGRLGDKLTDGTGVADFSGWYDLIERDVSQFMTTGGTLSLIGNEVITREGSTIDLSGGSVRYGDGYVRSTKLIDEFGRLVSVEQALAGVKYVGIEGDHVVSHARWGVTERFRSAFARSEGGIWQAGYDEGRSAGSLLLNNVVQTRWNDTGNPSNDAIRIFDGAVRADIVVGQYQQDAPSGAVVADVSAIWHERPAQATLAMGNFYASGNIRRPLGGNYTIADYVTQLGDDFTADTALIDYGSAADYGALDPAIQPYQHILPSSWFDGKTFGNVELTGGRIDEGSYQTRIDGTTQRVASPFGAGGVLTIGEGVKVDLGDFGSFRFSGRQANIDGELIAAGGSITLEAVQAPSTANATWNWNDVPEAERPGVHLGATGVIDVAGRWVNQLVDPNAPVRPIDGGSVTLVGYNIALDEGSLVDVGGGALLDAGNGLHLGNGGSIEIDATVPYVEAPFAASAPFPENEGTLALNGTLAGYAPGRGGSLTIDTALDIVLGDETILPGGMLEAGFAAPKDLILQQGITLPAGTILNFDAGAPVSRLVGGQTVMETLLTSGTSQPRAFVLVSRTAPVVTAAEWTVPSGVTIRVADGPTRFVEYAAGAKVPAGSSIFAFQAGLNNGFLPQGYTVPGNVFPNGIPLNTAQGTGKVAVPAGTPLPGVVLLPSGSTVQRGWILPEAVEIYVPTTYSPAMFSEGGFADHTLSGSRGMTIRSGTVIAPTVDIMRLDASVLADQASGARLSSLIGNGVTLQNSSELPEGLRPAMSLSLGTSPKETRATIYQQPIQTINPTRNPGTLAVETGSQILMTPGSSVTLDSRTRLSVDGTISTPGGTIAILDGFNSVPNAEVRIGANARLLAPGYQRTGYVDGLAVRSIERGGTITIGGEVGVVGAVYVADDAVLDVSGVAGIADLPVGGSGTVPGGAAFVPVSIDGAAGSLTIRASAGSLAGTWNLAAGGETGRGGTIALTSPGRGFEIRQSATDPLGEGASGATPYLQLVADTINASGADDVLLLAGSDTTGVSVIGGIVFNGDVSLSANRSLSLAAARISTVAGAGEPDVLLSAPHVKLTGSLNAAINPASPGYATEHRGTLEVRADLIDVAESVRFGFAPSLETNVYLGHNTGFEQLRFVSTGDIRFRNSSSATSQTFTSGGAGIVSGSDILFDAAQIYVTSQNEFLGNQFRERPEINPGFLVQSATSITVRSNGNAAPVPYSFGERLTLSAPVIEQGGVIRAPQGQIRLNASETLTLLPGSLTSVSLEGLTVPFGYLNLQGLFDGYDVAGQAPTKSITLSGPEVVASQGAVIDVSGGGDVMGWTFAGGNDGGTNLLADRSVERYAILPGRGAAPAPWAERAPVANSGVADSPLSDSRLGYGDSVWLENVPGLTAGWYTLLPAHYAMLDGAYLVEALGGQTAGALANQRLPDGSLITSGYRGVAGTGVREAGYSSFKLMSGNVWKPYANFVTASLNESIRDLADAADLPTVRTANDAGSVVLAATESLLLEATGRFAGGQGGLLGNLDVSAAKIALTGAGGEAPEGYLRLDATQLAAFRAGSILLGGMRAIGATGTIVTTNATDIVVTGDVALAIPELVLASKDRLTIEDAASLTATGTPSQDLNTLQLTGNGALLRLSAGERVGIARTGANDTAGTLAIGEATLATDGSLSLDGTRAIDLANTAVIDVAQLDLASVRVNIGDVPEGEEGTTIGLDTIARLGSASDLLIRGHQSINFYDGAVLGGRNANGTATLSALTLDTALLANRGAGASITAGTLTLRNSGAAAGGVTAAGTGGLALDVDRLALDNGAVSLRGFGAVNGSAGEIALAGTGSLDMAGAISLAAGRIMAEGPADYRVSATGDVALTGGTVPQGAEASAMGARLAIQGRSVSFDTRADLAAGTLELEAAGGNLALGGNARLDLKGRAVDFIDTPKFASGGTIRLTATGNVTTAAGALLDVSGDARGGDAGAITVAAGDRADLNGTMLALGHTDSRGGGFDLDAGGADFSALNALLNAGRFNASRDIHLRDQDILLAAGERIEAHQVTLRSGGDVRIAGTIAAAGNAVNADGGVVQLTGTNVLLEGTARIEAAAGTVAEGDYAPASGSVILAADEGRVSLASGSVIDLSGGRQGGGRIMVRATRTASGADAQLGGTVMGTREQILVGSEVYETGAIDASQVSAMLDEANGWLGSVSATAGWAMGAGIVVRSDGDLTVGSTIDLAGIAGPGYLGLEARGDLLVNASISDGFASAAETAALGSGASFSYGFRAGRDLLLGAGRIVRTGTGDIGLQAGRDIRLGSNSTVVYTAGRLADTRPGFVRTAAHGDYPTMGGDLRFDAGRDILSPVVNQSSAAWLFRHGATNWFLDQPSSTVAQQTSWSIIFRNFRSGIGALGGGNVAVSSGRDVQDLSIAIPTTGHLATATGLSAKAADLEVRGGGDLALSTGRDLLGGVILLGEGQGRITAGRDVAGGAPTQMRGNPGGTFFSPRPVNLLLGLSDATVTIEAVRHIGLEAAFDPMLLPQIAANLVDDLGSAWQSYSDRAGISLVSIGGDVMLRNNPYAASDLSRGSGFAAWFEPFNSSDPRERLPNRIIYLPPSLSIAALEGGLLESGVATSLAAARRGNLEVLISGDISNNGFALADVGEAYRRNALAPIATDENQFLNGTASGTNTNFDRGFTPLHLGDPDPVRLVSLTGNIELGGVSAPKPVMIDAAGDIVNFGITFQHNDPTEFSAITAGGDITAMSAAFLGQGALFVTAGGSITSAVGSSIQSRSRFVSAGNTWPIGEVPSDFPDQTNHALPDLGGDIHMIAGTANGIGYDAFAALYLDPANRADPAFPLAHPNNAGKVVQTYEAELSDYLTGLGYTEVTPGNRLALFESLAAPARQGFLNRVLFRELRATGIDYNDVEGPRFQQNARGYGAIDLLFPGGGTTDAAIRGDIDLKGGVFQTFSGGNLNLLAPYGGVTVGLANEEARNQGLGGLVTRRGGDVFVLADRNIALETSRVFTLQGGDILMWTSNGDITAGAGAKTSVMSVPLFFSMTNEGEVAVDVFGLSTGAGIGVLDALDGEDEDRPPSRLDLIAFRGEVNAGDAGIRVVGDLNIAALRVVNAANIEVSGEAVGIPTVAAVNTGALNAASAAAGAVTAQAMDLAERSRTPVRTEVPTIITARFVGFGE